MNAINGLFFAFLFFTVAFGIITVGLLTLYGGVHSFHHKRYAESVLYFVIFSFVFTGTSGALGSISENSTQNEHSMTEKEDYIQHWVFAEETVLIERTDSPSATADTFHVMMDKTAHIYEVTVYDDEAFGLYRYNVTSFNSDERLE